MQLTPATLVLRAHPCGPDSVLLPLVSVDDGFFGVVAAYGAVLLDSRSVCVQGPVPMKC